MSQEHDGARGCEGEGKHRTVSCLMLERMGEGRAQSDYLAGNPKTQPIQKILAGFVFRRSHQAYPCKEKQYRYNTNNCKCGYVACVINNFDAGVNKADNSQYSKYRPKGSF